MTQIIRRHWAMGVLLTVVLVFIFLWSIVPYLAREQASAQQGAAPTDAVDLVTYGRIEALRQELRLRNEDLAAMGLTQSQAGQVLTTLRSWVQQNRSALDRARENERRARSTLRATMRQFNVGPADETVNNQLAVDELALGAASSQSRQLTASVIPVVTAFLSGSQADIWNAARSNTDVPAHYRYATGLSQDQRLALRQMVNRGLSGPRLKDAEARVLGSSQRAQTDAVRGAEVIHMEGVLRAEAQVLPTPSQLLQQPDSLETGAQAAQSITAN